MERTHPSMHMVHARRIACLLALSCASFSAFAEEALAPLGEAQRARKEEFAASLPVEQALLTSAPHVPPPIERRHPARVIVDLEVREVVKKLADGVDYTFWTFGGEVPGLFIRVREGDLVEFHLHNHSSSKLPHNIDLHAVTGPGGGAAASLTAPGHSTVFSFKAKNPGLFVYHCATAPVPLHVANGMYGLILVEPRNGLPAVNREYYVMQSEFYTTGRFGEPGLQAFDMDKAVDEKPTYVVLNGSVGALTGDNAIKANVGETVRIYVGNGGPGLMSSFHVIGEIFDRVYQEAGTLANQLNVQTTVVPPGGASIVEFLVDVPGSYPLVDHALFRTFNKGALGILKVEGEGNAIVFSGNEGNTPYADKLPVRSAQVAVSRPKPQPVVATPPVAASSSEPVSDAVRFERGKAVFSTTCIACHGPEGRGVAGVFPPLAGSDYLAADAERAARVVIKGLTGPVTVNGVTYNTLMPPQALDDHQIADVIHYVSNSWGNKYASVTADDVKRLRSLK